MYYSGPLALLVHYAFNALSVPVCGTGQPPGVCGGPRNSSAPGVKSARRKLAASAVCECPKAWCSAKALNRRATANRSPNC